MAGIPRSAIKFYSSETFVTEVTSGTNAGATLYPKVHGPFTENLTGSNKQVTFPYNGRIGISGQATFVCGADNDVFTVNLPSAGEIKYINDSVGWTGIGTASNENLGLSYPDETNEIYIPKGSGNISFTFYTNSQYITGNPSVHNGASFVSQTINGVSSGDEPANAQTVNDIGRVVLYPVVLTYAITANPTIAIRNVLEYEYPNNGLKIRFVQAAGDANLTLSVSSVNVSNSTGLGSTPVTVNANTNWTIS